jgi:hypothetical protein
MGGRGSRIGAVSGAGDPRPHRLKCRRRELEGLDGQPGRRRVGDAFACRQMGAMVPVAWLAAGGVARGGRGRARSHAAPRRRDSYHPEAESSSEEEGQACPQPELRQRGSQYGPHGLYSDACLVGAQGEARIDPCLPPALAEFAPSLEWWPSG